MIKRTEWDDDTGTARWSDDGNVGLLVALRRPDLVRKLVFISAAANLDGYTATAQGDVDSTH